MRAGVLERREAHPWEPIFTSLYPQGICWSPEPRIAQDKAVVGDLRTLIGLTQRLELETPRRQKFKRMPGK